MKKGRRVNLAIGYTGQAEVVRAGQGPYLGWEGGGVGGWVRTSWLGQGWAEVV